MTLLREVEHAERSASEGLTLSEEQGFPYFAARCRISLGWALSQRDRQDEGIALLRAGLNGMAQMGTLLGIPVYLTWLADALASKGETVDALDTIEQALRANPVELVYRPETIRLRGDLRLKAGNNELAEADYAEAISLSRRIGAKVLELRAVTSLARAMQSRGTETTARNTLETVYASFTEGFATNDLVDAKQVLDDLAICSS